MKCIKSSNNTICSQLVTVEATALDSVGRSIFIFRVGHCEEILQLPLQGFKGRPLHWVLKIDQVSSGTFITVMILYLVPALEHNVIQRRCTALGRLHPVSMLHLVQDLSIGHTCRDEKS